MYVGAWQEYKLMKVIENLREENQRLRQESSGGLATSTSPCRTDYDRGSSHHFLTMMGDAPVSHTEVLPSSSTPISDPSKRRKQTKPTTILTPSALKFVTTVRDVDVFREGQNEAEETLQIGRDDGALLSSSRGGSAGGSESLQRLSVKDSGRLHSSRHRQPSAPPSHAEGHMAAHVHLGTGAVVGGPLSRPIESHPIENSTSAQSSAREAAMGCQRVLRGHPLVQDLVRGAPLETKALYKRAGQPVLSERPVVKNHGKADVLSDAQIQERVDRRLRLQMLYSCLGRQAGDVMNNFSGLATVQADIPEQQQQQVRADLVLNEQQTELPLLSPGVPWDTIPLDHKYSVMAHGNHSGTHPARESSPVEKVTAYSFQIHVSSASTGRVGSSLPALRHPYDVGVPLAPPRIESCNNTGNSERGIMAHRTKFSNREIEDDRVPREQQSDFLCIDDGVLRNSSPDPVDDDTIGALIDWAEQLDPESVL